MKLPKISLKNIKASFQTRAFKVGSYSVAATLVVIAIAVVVNLLAGALPNAWMEFDTSSNKLFTLSEQTENLVAGLENEVTVYWIVRGGYEDTYIETLLDKYSALSSKLKVEKKDPDLYPNFTEQYTDSFTENSLVVATGDRFRYVDYNDIYVIDYEAYYYYGTEDWSFYGEQELTSAIDYAISENLPKLYLLTGHGEQSVPTTFATAIDDENIETAELSLLTVEAVPEDADAVLINAPQSDLSEEEKTKLEAYLAQGGKLLFLSDLPEEGTLTNFEAMMASYGVTLNAGLVVEGNQNYYAWGYPYYLLPEMASHTVTSPLVSGNYRVILPVSQGMTVSEELPDGITVTSILTTSEDAFSKIAGYSLSTYEKEEGDIDGPFSLAVVIEDSNTESQIIWVSSGALLDEKVNSMVSGGNQDLFLNMVNYLCEPEGSSISIHAKSLTTEYLTMDSGASSALALLMIGVLPVAYLAFGILTWYRRKRR